MVARTTVEEAKYKRKCELLALARQARAANILMKNKKEPEEVKEEEKIIKKKVTKSKKVIEELPEPESLHDEPEIEPKIENPEPEIEEPKVRKPRAKKETVKKLDLNICKDVEIEHIDEVVQEVVEIRKIKRPKKLIKKIIKEVYETDSEDDNILEEVIIPPVPVVEKKVKKNMFVMDNKSGPFRFNF